FLLFNPNPVQDNAIGLINRAGTGAGHCFPQVVSLFSILRRPGEGNGLHQHRRPPAAGHRQRPFVRTTPVAAPDHVPVPHPDLDQAMVMVARQGQMTVAGVSFITTRLLPSTSHRTRPHSICPTLHTARPPSNRVWLFYVAPEPRHHHPLPSPNPPKASNKAKALSIIAKATDGS